MIETRPSPVDYRTVSGEDYDWRITRKPERPYIHDYTKSICMKMFLASPEGIHISVEKALEMIRAMDRITLGLHKILFIVGWQYNGHDTGYPAWFEANPGLKRPEDPDAETSIRWLMREAKKYNTSISFHVNVSDAYEDSPIWDEYVKNDLICRSQDGVLTKGGVWGGRQCYLICYEKEWNSGFTAKRLDYLLDTYPIEEAGVLYLDALHNPCNASGQKCGSLRPSEIARNKICRYLRSRGVDVVSEHIYCDPPTPEGKDQMIGLMPFGFDFSQNLDDYMTRPAQLVSGGENFGHFKGLSTKKLETLFGNGIQCETYFHHDNYREQFLDNFMRQFLPYRFLSQRDRLSVTISSEEMDHYTVRFSDGVETQLKERLITRNGTVLRKNQDLMLPAEWLPYANVILYSPIGGENSWNVSEFLGADIEKVNIREITIEGLSETFETVDLADGCLKINQKPYVAYLVTRSPDEIDMSVYK